MIDSIQNQIYSAKNSGFDISKLSDGYHSFDELYEVRCLLFIALIKAHPEKSWRASANHDGQKWEGWFVCGINPEKGKQVTFHLPEKFWSKLDGIETHEINPYFDGHTSADVLARLDSLF